MHLLQNVNKNKDRYRYKKRDRFTRETKFCKIRRKLTFQLSRFTSIYTFKKRFFISLFFYLVLVSCFVRKI